MLTTMGTVAQYANITHGWDLSADGMAHLTYYFGSLTAKVPAATVESEILRAMNQWSSNGQCYIRTFGDRERDTKYLY